MIDKIIKTLRWCKHRKEGEFIEQVREGWCRDHLGFKCISQKELDSICVIVGGILKEANYPFSISNSMGEIVPTGFHKFTGQAVCCNRQNVHHFYPEYLE